jgi:hypothetical protein
VNDTLKNIEKIFFSYLSDIAYFSDRYIYLDGREGIDRISFIRCGSGVYFNESLNITIINFEILEGSSFNDVFVLQTIRQILGTNGNDSYSCKSGL